jgi:hypothetical protein
MLRFLSFFLIFTLIKSNSFHEDREEERREGNNYALFADVS